MSTAESAPSAQRALPGHEANGAAETASTQLPARSSRRWIPAVALAGVVLLGGAYYRHAHAFEDTDDAQVDGEISAISPRVAGTVKTILVVENQVVKVGDVLAELDPADFDVSVAQAKAALAQAEAQLAAEVPAVSMTETTNATLAATTGSDISTAQADLAAAAHSLEQANAIFEQARANEKLASLDFERAKKLAEGGSIANAELDQRSAQADVAKASLTAAEQGKRAASDRVNQARSRVGAAVSRAGEVKDNGPRLLVARRATIDVRKASVELARAQLAQAELNRTYTKILAPVAGVVGKKTVSLGDRVQPGQQLMAVTRVEKLWITANFRETQLKDMHANQPVKVYVDALDHDLSGTVESIGGATGARYSLLPPENAVGNYVKVVQRVPVRIRLDEGQPELDRLRPGLSVEPKVRVR